MQTVIQGKEIETTYSVKAVRNKNGVLTKKPKLVKKSKVVKWDNLFDPIDGKIEYNNIHNNDQFQYRKSINISEDEEVLIEGQIYRVDIDSLMLHTSKVIHEKKINKVESEEELKTVMTEYNHLIIDNNPKMKAYCNSNKIDIDTVNIDDIETLFNDKGYGKEAHTLTVDEMPTLSHGVAMRSDGCVLCKF